MLFPIEPGDETSRLQRLYDRLAARFGLGAAEVRLSHRKLTGGEIRYGPPHVITISAHLSENERLDTLLHETAHAWAFARQGPGAGHGPVFRRLARWLGVRGRQAPLTPALKEFRARRGILYRCEGCLRSFPRFRALRGAHHCVACDRAGRPSRLQRVRE
ncbi:MAG TPA: SprT-like domain-containing protein [Thermoanaerobaculia bacterium]|nr:SprT-like domain-containing protein [Thermoanaerobaculia bacterium]